MPPRLSVEKVKTSFRLPKPDLEWLQAYSESQGRTVSSQLLILVRQLRTQVEESATAD